MIQSTQSLGDCKPPRSRSQTAGRRQAARGRWGWGAVRRRNSKPAVRGGTRASVKGQVFQPIKGQRQRLLPGRGGRKLGLGGGGEGSYQCKPGAEVSGRRRFGAPFSVHFFFRTPRLPPGGLGIGGGVVQGTLARFPFPRPSGSAASPPLAEPRGEPLGGRCLPCGGL